MADVVTGVMIVILAGVVVIGYLVMRARQPAPPPPANADEQPEGPLADDDPVPRDSDGMPLVAPPDDPGRTDAGAMQREARRPHQTPRRP